MLFGACGPRAAPLCDGAPLPHCRPASAPQRFPAPVTHNEPIGIKIEDIRSSVKWQLKKVTCLNAAVGNETMSNDELRTNIMMSINFLVSLLKKGWHNIKTVNIKATMSPSIKVY